MKKFLSQHAEDLLFFFALLAMSAGFSWAWLPLGFIAFGGVICVPMLVHRMFPRKEE